VTECPSCGRSYLHDEECPRFVPCCGATDSPRLGRCRDCDARLCSSCAAVWDGPVGPHGELVEPFALCSDCAALRGERDQRREARNDSGV
jgi:hypothetical protein